MARSIAIVLGLLQLAGAGVLGWLACRLPTPDQAEQPYHQAAALLRQADDQLALALRPPGAKAEPPSLAPVMLEQLLANDNVQQLRSSLDATASGLDLLAGTLDTDLAKKTGTGLGQAADFLDRQVIPAATTAARQLDEATAKLQADAHKVAEQLRAARLDLKQVEEVEAALGRFADGLQAVDRIIAFPELAEMRKGLQGAGTALAKMADTADNVADKTYPAMKLEGVKPKIEFKSFWPEGKEVARGLRDTGVGVQAADKQLARLPEETARVRAALEASRTVLERSRATLGQVLKHRDRLETLLQSLPETATQLAEMLPKLVAGVSGTLRDTQRLQETAAGLRATQSQVERAVATWPEVQKMFRSTSQALRTNRKKLDQAVAVYALWKRLSKPGPAAPAEPTAAPVAPALSATLRQAAEAQAAQAGAARQGQETVRWALLLAAALVGLQGLATLTRPGPRGN